MNESNEVTGGTGYDTILKRRETGERKIDGIKDTQDVDRASRMKSGRVKESGQASAQGGVQIRSSYVVKPG